MNLQPRRKVLNGLELGETAQGILARIDASMLELTRRSRFSIWAMELPATAYTADMTGRVAAFWFLSNERVLPKLATSGKA
jgi:hypothetical protein